jgi:hypothetical protein
MEHEVSLSNGHNYKGVLVVENMKFGHSSCEVRGFRLSWMDPGTSCGVPALGLATSNPFRTEGEAIAYGEKHYGVKAQRLPRYLATLDS